MLPECSVPCDGIPSLRKAISPLRPVPGDRALAVLDLVLIAGFLPFLCSLYSWLVDAHICLSNLLSAMNSMGPSGKSLALPG